MIVRIPKGTYVLCRCDVHYKVWKQGEDGCQECIAEEKKNQYGIGVDDLEKKLMDMTIPKPDWVTTKTLKEGVRVLSNGRFMKDGKLIKSSEAYK